MAKETRVYLNRMQPTLCVEFDGERVVITREGPFPEKQQRVIHAKYGEMDHCDAQAIDLGNDIMSFFKT